MSTLPRSNSGGAKPKSHAAHNIHEKSPLSRAGSKMSLHSNSFESTGTPTRANAMRKTAVTKSDSNSAGGGGGKTFTGRALPKLTEGQLIMKAMVEENRRSTSIEEQRRHLVTFHHLMIEQIKHIIDTAPPPTGGSKKVPVIPKGTEWLDEWVHAAAVQRITYKQLLAECSKRSIDMVRPYTIDWLDPSITNRKQPQDSFQADFLRMEIPPTCQFSCDQIFRAIAHYPIISEMHSLPPNMLLSMQIGGEPLRQIWMADEGIVMRAPHERRRRLVPFVKDMIWLGPSRQAVFQLTRRYAAKAEYLDKLSANLDDDSTLPAQLMIECLDQAPSVPVFAPYLESKVLSEPDVTIMQTVLLLTQVIECTPNAFDTRKVTVLSTTQTPVNISDNDGAVPCIHLLAKLLIAKIFEKKVSWTHLFSQTPHNSTPLFMACAEKCDPVIRYDAALKATRAQTYDKYNNLGEHYDSTASKYASN